MQFNWLYGMFSNDLAIDLGTANTLIYSRGKGIVLAEPSVVAVKSGSSQILKVGREAKEMVGRTPASIDSIRPIRDGVIADFDITEQMIRHFIVRVHEQNALVRPRIVISVPSKITQVEKRAIRESAEQAGAREVYMIEEPMAAAIGAGLPVQEPSGNVVVDIGGGTTEVAVISLAGIVNSQCIRIAGDKMDEAIIQFLKRHHSLLVGQPTAELIKIQAGSAYPLGQPKSIEIRGQDLMEGIPKTVTVSDTDVREALRVPTSAIVNVVRATLEHTPPDLAADVAENGIIMTGGGSLLPGLPTLIGLETHLNVTLAQDPLTCGVLGAGKVLEELDVLRSICLEN